jgi:hypothetical protein
VLVTGPPGVGKSRLLEEAAGRFNELESPGAGSDLVELEHRSGSLQVALLSALGTALARFESTEDLTARWGRVFRGALQRAADATAQDMIRGATTIMNGAVRARLGDPAADALERFEAGLTQALDEQLAHRIRAEADPGATRAFCALAAEVQKLVEGPILLTFDRAERLADPDFRQLLDLLELLPADVHLNIGQTRARPADEDRITRIKAGATNAGGTAVLTVVDLAGLDENTVARWMIDQGLEPGRESDELDEVMRVTSGYPFHVDLALRAVDRGESLDQLTGDDALRLMIQQNYRVLNGDDQRTLMLIAAFTDPPDDQILLEVLGVDSTDWAVLQRRLVDARFLVSTVYGMPWFHELGRRVLWNEVLSDAQRTSAATAAVQTLLGHVASAERVRISYCIDLAKLGRFAPEHLEAHAGARAVLDLDRASLAILGALEELTGAENPAGFIGDVVSHARRRFPAEGDFYDAAEHLDGQNLVVISKNDEDQVLVPFWGSPEARALGLGRIIVEFGRAPVREVAAAVLHSVVIPHCGEFHVASLGSGYATLTTLSREMRERQVHRDGNHVSMHDRPGIIFRAALGSLEFGGAISFNDRVARDEALAAITSEASPSRVFGEPWTPHDVYAWPQPEPLAARRFTAAAELLTGVNFHFGLTAPSIPNLPTVASYLEEMELVVRTWRTLSRLTTHLEAAVLDLTRPRGIAFADVEGGVCRDPRARRGGRGRCSRWTVVWSGGAQGTRPRRRARC